MTDPTLRPSAGAPPVPSSPRKKRAIKLFDRISSFVVRNKDTITIYILILTLAASTITAIYIHTDAQDALIQTHLDAQTAERATFTSQLYSKQVDKIGEFISQCDAIIPLLVKRAQAMQPASGISESDSLPAANDIKQIQSTAQQLRLILPEEAQHHVDTAVGAINKYVNLLYLVALQKNDQYCLNFTNEDFKSSNGFDFVSDEKCSLRRDVLRYFTGAANVVLNEKEALAKGSISVLSTGDYLGSQKATATDHVNHTPEGRK